MKEKDFEKSINGMKEKLGEETSGLILDDLGLLIADNTNMNNEIKQKDEEIEQLKKDKENLLQVNGNLFKQVSMGEEQKEKEDDDPKKKESFDFRLAFDEKRKF